MPSNPLTQAERLAGKLGIDGPRQADFLAALERGMSGRTALIATPAAPPDYCPPFPAGQDIPEWMSKHTFLLDEDAGAIPKPGSHDDYQRGYYYPLDLSSVWETAPLSQLQTPSRCLDLCASPGGKSILAQTRLSPGIHIANEIHPKRLGVLRSNLARCGFNRLWTQRLRPDQWKQLAPASFDLVLVDAPCSGQSLLAKGMENPGCFHPSTMKGNAKRQRGILLSILDAAAPGGHILYTTCTFAPDENEKTMAFILKRRTDMEAVYVPLLQSFQSPLTDFPCYRLLPTDGWGSGGFTCLLRKRGATPRDLPELPQEVLAWSVDNSLRIEP